MLHPFVDVGVEHSLKAVDDLRGADQQARRYFLPLDAIELWTNLFKKAVQIKIFLAYVKVW